MLNENQKQIVADLQFLKMDDVLIASVLASLETQESQKAMLNSLMKNYKKKGSLTESDIITMVIMLTAKKKNE